MRCAKAETQTHVLLAWGAAPGWFGNGNDTCCVLSIQSMIEACCLGSCCPAWVGHGLLTARPFDLQVHIVVDAVSSQRTIDRAAGLNRAAQSGAFLVTSEMALFQLMQVRQLYRTLLHMLPPPAFVLPT